ncbi:hypothetical protein [Tenacibaculum aestuariivivum]|uniref:hypothetical protein n=1 Tax=Tenacibaculum aestuariivivum TaxID=2006131 RepID=UPI003AB16AB9
MKIKICLILTLLINYSFYAQVKIGENPSVIHLNSILELESSDKALVISRMTTNEMNAMQPLKGALIFNTNENCVFVYDGTLWKNLCNTTKGINVTTTNSAPVNNNLGDFWINNSLKNTTSIWDGTNWISIDNNPKKGNGTPTITNNPNPIAGELYIDSSTGNIYAYNGTNWVASNTKPTANNGLLINSNNTIQLGGELIKPTIIKTSPVNTLAITNLEDGDVTQDEIVTVNKTTGQLKKVTATNLFREEVTQLIASDGQLTFNGLTLYSNDKVNVYRNGVRVDFVIINNTTIQIEADAICYQGDQIKIVQFY